MNILFSQFFLIIASIFVTINYLLKQLENVKINGWESLLQVVY